MPFGVHPVLHRPRVGRQCVRQQCHQCLSAFTPFSTRRVLGNKSARLRVTNAFRRSPRSPQNNWMEKGRNGCLWSPMPFGVHPVLHGFAMPHPTFGDAAVTNAFRRSPRSPPLHIDGWCQQRCVSPMPFGVHPVLHLNARVEEASKADLSPMPFGVHPVLHLQEGQAILKMQV